MSMTVCIQMYMLESSQRHQKRHQVSSLIITHHSSGAGLFLNQKLRSQTG